MATRIGYWAAGVATGMLLVVMISPAPFAGLYGAAFCVGLFGVGLFGEVVVAFRSLRSPRRIDAPADARPADGRVEVVPIRGAHGIDNATDPRFSAFEAPLPTEDSPSPRLARNRTMPPLLGRVAIVSVFLGRDGRGWSEAEIARAHAGLIRAGTWLEREAIRWGAPVNVAVAGTYFVADDATPDHVELSFVPEGDGVGPLEAGATTKALIDLSRAAALLGFRDAEDWMARINPRIEADVHVWLLHPRRAGRSLAVALDQTELAGVSLGVCYARESNVPERLTGPPFTDPVTVAHELLHLFGAADKYGVSLGSFPPKSVSSRDIMRLNESMLSRLRIDPCTAWEIGWTGPR